MQTLFRITVALGIDLVCFGNLPEGFLELKKSKTPGSSLPSI